ncbi:MAG: plastocyanin [Rhodocyclaceae bacterium]|nr:plastocyanin [Rhodocyclaceae bacterium]
MPTLRLPFLRKPLTGLAIGLTGLGASAATLEVHIRDYAFLPAELVVQVGDTVRWTNDEKRTSHSVVLLIDGQAQESERFFPEESWSHVFDRPGRIEYRCGPHPEMRGAIVVRP